jgi:hypothetical protein
VTKKTKFFGENKQIFFEKKQVLVDERKYIFCQKKNEKKVFEKKKRPLNYPFKKTDTFSFAHTKSIGLRTPPPHGTCKTRYFNSQDIWVFCFLFLKSFLEVFQMGYMKFCFWENKHALCE